MASQEVINNFEQRVSVILRYDGESFFKGNYGDGSLTELRPQFDDLKKKLGLIKIDILVEIANSTVEICTSALTGLITLIKKTASLDQIEYIREKQNTKAQFQNLINNFNAQWPSFLSIINSIIIDKLSNSEEFGKQIQTLAEELKSAKEKSEKDSEALAEKLKTVEERYTNVAVKSEIEINKYNFGDEARSNRRTAMWWLVPSTILLIILCGLIKFFWDNICLSHLCVLEDGICQYCKLKSIGVEYTQSLFIFDNIRILLFKAFCISFNVYLLTFCLKQFQIQMHNYTINKHKANSLSSATFLLDAIGKYLEGKDEPTKKEIIMKATEAIFSHQKTGYSSKGTEPDLNMILNLLKNLKA